MCFTSSATKDEPARVSRPAQPRQSHSSIKPAPSAGGRTGPTARPSATPSSLPQYGKEGYFTKGQISTHEGATMKLMQNKKTKELVAAKWIPRMLGHGLPKNVEREIVNHRKLLHPNIIRFKEVFMTDDCLVIVMEYASGGPLQDRIKTSGRLAEAEAKRFFGQLVDGIMYCHSQHIFHRDLRMENLLLQGSYYDSILKISNFGYSKSAVLDSVAVTLGLGGGGQGQVLYSSPELLLGHPSREGYDGAAVDIWASGVILYNMLTGHMPFVDPAEPNVMNAKVNQRIIRGSYELPQDVPLSRECQDMLSRIFVTEPKRRIKAPQMKQHPWLAGTKMPEAPPALSPAAQTEDDILAVVMRAKARRANADSADLDTARNAQGPTQNGSYNAP